MQQKEKQVSILKEEGNKEIMSKNTKIHTRLTGKL